jgi:hypothetical protein
MAAGNPMITGLSDAEPRQNGRIREIQFAQTVNAPLDPASMERCLVTTSDEALSLISPPSPVKARRGDAL